MITKEDALRTLEEVVEEFGTGHRTEACVYKDAAGQPSCIVGHVWSRLVPDWDEYRAVRENYGLFWLTPELRDHPAAVPLFSYFPEMTPEAIEVLKIAQATQDGCLPDGNTWGDALQAAKARAKSRAEAR